MSDEEKQEEPAESTEQKPVEISNDSKNMGMLCHLMTFCAFIVPVIGAILGPLIFWLIKKDSDPVVDREGKKSINFQITVFIIVAGLMVISILPFLGFITLPLIALVSLADLIFIIIAAVKTSNGEIYEYPFTLNLLK